MGHGHAQWRAADAPNTGRQRHRSQFATLFATVYLMACMVVGLTIFMALPTPILAQTNVDTVDDLWIDMSMRPQLVEEYNRIARPQDIARADHVSMVDVLDEVTQGRRLLVFKSVADAEMLVPRLSDKFDIIGYNLESGPANRPDEQADPVGSVIRMRDLADRYDKELAMGPDRHFALNDGVAMAPYVDIFILQVQRVQEDPATVRAFLEPLARQYRSVNPDLQISAQIRTEGDTAELRALTESLTDILDGISILTSPETVTVADALLAELRPNGAAPGFGTSATVVAVVPTPTPAEAQDLAEAETSTQALPTAAASTDTSSPQVDATPAAVVQQTTIAPTPLDSSIDQPATAETDPEAAFDQRWFMIGSLLTIGILGGGLLIASIVYAYQNMGSR